jgi:hypothetical protein
MGKNDTVGSAQVTPLRLVSALAVGNLGSALLPGFMIRICIQLDGDIAASA